MTLQLCPDKGSQYGQRNIAMLCLAILLHEHYWPDPTAADVTCNPSVHAISYFKEFVENLLVFLKFSVAML